MNDAEFIKRLMELSDKMDSLVKTDELMAMDRIFFIPFILTLMKQYELKNDGFHSLEALLEMLDMECMFLGVNMADIIKLIISSDN